MQYVEQSPIPESGIKLYDDLLYEPYEMHSASGDYVLRKYTLPFCERDEEQLCAIRPEFRKQKKLKQFYIQLGQNVVHDQQVTSMILGKIPSILPTQLISSNSDGSVSEIVISTPWVRPLTEIPVQELTVGFVVDMCRRLLAICKDLSAHGIVHRNIHPSNIFFDENNRMYLGGFYNAYVQGQHPTPVNALYTAHVAPAVKAGETGDVGTDMYSIASIMLSLVTGQSLLTDPEQNGYMWMPAALRDAISVGLSGDAEKYRLFKQLLGRIYKKGIGIYWSNPVTILGVKQLSGAVEENNPNKFSHIAQSEWQKKSYRREKKKLDQKQITSSKRKGRISRDHADGKTTKDIFGMVFSYLIGLFLMVITMSIAAMTLGIVSLF